VERDQVERLRALRARRSPEPWRAALDAVEDRARSGQLLLPALIDAVSASATVGEIAGRLRQVFGEHRETLVL
jgi:methylmalonyl-CoA mutase N-terminal domain/subunit